MEPTSVALGILALAGLFNTCIELADHVSRASNLSRDYEATYTKFLLLKSRLYAWKPCLAVLAQDHMNADTEERILVGRSLTATKNLLETARNLEQCYAPDRNKKCNEKNNQPQPESWKSLADTKTTLDVSSKQGHSETSWSRKLRWAIRDKKKFDVLICDLSFHVNELEKLAARLQAPTTPLLQYPTRLVQMPVALGMQCAEPDSNQYSTYAAGHVFLQNQMAGDAKAMLGNVGMLDDVGRNHLYAGNHVTGNARLVMGNVAGGSMAEFWGL